MSTFESAVPVADNDNTILTALAGMGIKNVRIYRAHKPRLRTVRIPGMIDIHRERDRMRAINDVLTAAGIDVLGYSCSLESEHDRMIGGTIIVRPAVRAANI